MSESKNGSWNTPQADLFWAPSRMIVLGYYDGPTEGVIQFENGLVFRFFMPDEEVQLARHWIAREYVFHPMPVDSLDPLERVLAEHLTPVRPSWCVNWHFNSSEIAREMDDKVAAILAEAGPALWSVTVPDCWTLQDFHPTRIIELQPA